MSIAIGTILIFSLFANNVRTAGLIGMGEALIDVFCPQQDDDAYWCIYSLDMTLHIEDDVEGITYTDDTQLVISGPESNLPGMIETMQRALSRLSDWFSENRLKINAKKTQLIMFGSRAVLKNVPSITLHFNGNVIRETKVVKNLDLYMDRNMTFSDHVKSVVSKCSGALIALIHAKHSLPKASIKPIVNALVISSVRYCLSIYGT